MRSTSDQRKHVARLVETGERYLTRWTQYFQHVVIALHAQLQDGRLLLVRRATAD